MTRTYWIAETTTPEKLWTAYQSEHDELEKAIRGLTDTQTNALLSNNQIIVVEGGNQSGKTWLACVDAVSYALNRHPIRKWRGAAPAVWYCTTTMELFSQQAWKHIERLLLYPGESTLKLPTHHIKHILWDKAGLRPKQVLLNNGAEIVVKAYAQGPGEFQAKTLDHGVLDEECEDAIWTEINARLLASREPRLFIPATPIKGVGWLEGLRDMAAQGVGGVSHFRLKTLDNPGANRNAIDGMIQRFIGRPEELKLRLEGIPFHAQGMVYPDTIFTADHICKHFEIPRDWSLTRSIDHGYRNCACLWFAVSPNEDTVALYRDYLGQEKTLKQNCEAIRSFEYRERYSRTWIDPATLGKDAESGKRVIDLWHAHGVRCVEAPNNRIISGIEMVKDLLGEMGGPTRNRPRFRVFDTCYNFLSERRGYRWNLEKDKGDERPERPEKRADHCMDAWRYYVAAGIKHIPMDVSMPKPDPQKNPVAYAYWLQRQGDPGPTL